MLSPQVSTTQGSPVRRHWGGACERIRWEHREHKVCPPPLAHHAPPSPCIYRFAASIRIYIPVCERDGETESEENAAPWLPHKGPWDSPETLKSCRGSGPYSSPRPGDRGPRTPFLRTGPVRALRGGTGRGNQGVF